ncbi:hypothetical protein KUCAC02_000638 [Chaenocephalus aceratus]|uniref:Uncharacterized protein n=1 Tax=Chaenocephalus aceratus TaxID=36190 RepID=A0ACB9W6U8_CHAAC|nr:hypothetical protein KUCAC02_000638 [Chaenocephalus aceratus]
MDCERSDGGGEGGEAEVEDEFAGRSIDGQQRADLAETTREEQRREVGKVICERAGDQEEQQELSYPGALHCIFSGARGLFMDCLTKSTSAHIVVGSTGFLLISGLAEPVVRAYSLITDMVERYESTQSRRSETTDRGMGETLDSRRAFKRLVENWEDKQSWILLFSPGVSEGNPAGVCCCLQGPEDWQRVADEKLLLSPQVVVGQSEAASISTEVKDVRGEDEEQKCCCQWETKILASFKVLHSHGSRIAVTVRRGRKLKMAMNRTKARGTDLARQSTEKKKKWKYREESVDE